MAWQSATTLFIHLISSPSSQNCIQVYPLIISITWSSFDRHITLQRRVPSSRHPTPWLPWLGTSLTEPLTEQTEPCHTCPHSLHAACLILPCMGAGEWEAGWGWPSGCDAHRAQPDPSHARLALLVSRALLTHLHLAIGRTFRSLSTALLSSLSFPSLHTLPGLPHLRCRIQHLPLLNFIWLVIAHFSNLSRSLCNLSRSLHKYVVQHNKHVVLIIVNLDKMQSRRYEQAHPNP